MKMPDFVVAQSSLSQGGETFAIGETGFAFSRSQRPAATLTSWNSGKAIPDAARKVLDAQAHFRNIVGLVGVPTESDAVGALSAEWILGRTFSDLVSIVVRDGGTCKPNQLLDDTAFGIVEAKRFCATAVIVLVQESGNKDADRCRSALQNAFQTGSVESNVLYASKFATELPVWFASISAEPL